MEGRQVMNEPARGYSWPNAEPGNLIARKHGAWSERLVAQRAVELVEAGVLPDDVQLAGLLRWVGDADRWAADAWRRWEATVVRLVEWLEVHGLEDADGNLRESVIGLLLRAERAAAMHRDQLGLSPTARARLLRDQASAAASGTSALEAVARAGRAARERRERAGGGGAAGVSPGALSPAESGSEPAETGDSDDAPPVPVTEPTTDERTLTDDDESDRP
jgi:hypothetical protein